MPRTNDPAAAPNVPSGIVTAYALTIDGRHVFSFRSVDASVGYNSLWVPPAKDMVCLQALVLLETMNLL